ncbi:MAG: hypothetical protein IJU69_00865 [Bacteroidales bacterium]|nr:hypothetical protein [Bacteroidales bacterium]
MRKNLLLIVICVILMVLHCKNCIAQTPYPEVNFEDYSTLVKISGKTPTIVDFVNDYLANPEDELTGALSEMWKRQRSSKAQKDKGDKVIVDVKNGYVRFENAEEYDCKELSVTEFCFWNCSGGEYIVVANNTYLFIDGAAREGQYCGLSLSLYSKKKRLITAMGTEDLGLETLFEQETVTSGYDSKKGYYIEYPDGKRILMNEKEYFAWLEKKPVRVWNLPRYGKDLVLKLYSKDKVLKQKTFIWDGLHFKEIK